MIKITSLQAIAAALLACGLAAAPAQAGPNRTFVSGTGTDSDTCTRAAPCRTFAFAITVTNAGGEIDVLDPAGYGPVTILHAISIVNDGVGTAGITAGSSNAITITAGTSDSVHLRGLTLTGLRTGTNGILFNTGGNLEIENCVVWGFTTAGLNIAPSTSSTFSVSNTIASNNSNSGVAGIFIAPTGSAVVSGVLSNVTANNNFSGIFVDGAPTTGATLKVTIADSEASNNSDAGVFADGTGGAATAVLLRNVVASNNGIGLRTAANATLPVAHSVVTGNNTGVFASGGTLDSYGNNDINGNTNNNYGALTTIPTH
jgi:Right handed beta helix region